MIIPQYRCKRCGYPLAVREDDPERQDETPAGPAYYLQIIRVCPCPVCERGQRDEAIAEYRKAAVLPHSVMIDGVLISGTDPMEVK